MKTLKIVLFSISLLTLISCEIVQETKFEPSGSGTYSLGFDLSEMMKMGGNNKKGSKNKQLDTLIIFSDFLEAKKDSISKLSKEKQAKIKELKDFSLNIKADSVSKTFKMKINYNFNNVSELKLFGEKLKGQNIKELDLLTSKTKNLNSKDDSFPDFNKSFNTVFNKDSFSMKITPEAIAEAEKKKDTTMTKDNPMANMIRFKSRYLFPYKIKKVSNKNVRILSDFKGIEINANLFEVNNNPKYFDLEIEFEKN